MFLRTHVKRYSKQPSRDWRGSKIECDKCTIMIKKGQWQKHKDEPHDHNCKNCNLKFVGKFELIHHIDNIHTTDEVEVGEVSMEPYVVSDSPAKTEDETQGINDPEGDKTGDKPSVEESMNEAGNVDTNLTEESEGDENDVEESSESPSITPERAQQKMYLSSL
mgnify:CR=1 FL=1